MSVSTSDVIAMLIDALLTAGVYASMAYGLSLIYGVMKIVNLAHAGFIMLGAFTAMEAVNRLHADPVVAAVLLVFPVFFAAGMAVEALLVRRLPPGKRTGLPSLLLLCGLWLVIQNTGYLVWGPDQHSLLPPYAYSSLKLGSGISLPLVRTLVFAVAIVSLVLVQLFLSRTLTGKAIRAVAQNPVACSLAGVNVDRVSTMAFGLGTGFSALGGALLALLYSFTPDFGGQFLVRSFAVVVLGGLESFGGVILGALALAFAEGWGAFLFGSGWQLVIAFGLMVLTLLFVPKGLAGLLRGGSRA